MHGIRHFKRLKDNVELEKELGEKNLFTFNDLDARLSYTPLWKDGITGKGTTIAILDTGINRIEGLKQSIIIEKDFTGENNPSDWKNMHGTKIATAIHFLAPRRKDCKL